MIGFENMVRSCCQETRSAQMGAADNQAYTLPGVTEGEARDESPFKSFQSSARPIYDLTKAGVFEFG